MQIPDSTVILKDLKSIYKQSLNTHECFVGQKISRNIMSTYDSLSPNLELIGCKKNSKVMNEYIKYLELMNSRDYTSEVEFEGKIERLLNKFCMKGLIKKIDGCIFGSKDINRKDINIDRLISKKYIPFSEELMGIYIDQNMLLKRPKYSWFCRLSQRQLMTCDNIICKWLIIALN